MRVRKGDGVRTGTKTWPETVLLLPALTKDEQSPNSYPLILSTATKVASPAGRLEAQSLPAFPVVPA